MRVAIVGTRDYKPGREPVREYVRQLPSDTVVVTGGARGVDSWAEDAARECGIEVKVWPADWTKHGKIAGMIRNDQIVKDSDKIVAFWDGYSKGTWDTISKARRAGKVVEVIQP